MVRTILLASVVALGGCKERGGAESTEERPPAVESAAVVRSPTASPPVAPGPRATGPAALTQVDDVSQVCMVNDQFMGSAQIPVVVEGKTYFGCCEMCKGRLSRDAEARVAKDPVSGNVVDKSSAVIAKREDGRVLYFENAQNLERFQSGAI